MVKGEGQSNATSSAAPVTEVHPTEDPEPAVSPVESPPVSRSAGPAPVAFVLSSSGSEEALECPPVPPVLASPVTSEARRSPVPVPRLLPPKPVIHSDGQFVQLMDVGPKCATGTGWYDEIGEPSLKRSSASVESDEDDPSSSSSSRVRLKRSESSSS